MSGAKPYDWRVGEPMPILGEHSVAKHEIFEQYLGIYIERVTRTRSQTMLNLTIVDGFCGGGLYRRGIGEAEGSPLRLLRAVEEADAALKAARIKGFQVRADFVFVDENADHIAFLRDVLIKRGFGPRIGQDIFLHESTFEEACPGIVERIQQKGRAHRSLFFLDQYGWSDVRLATVRGLFASLRNPEVILTFAVDALIDFLSVKTAESQALLNIDMTREDVRALTSMRTGEGWRFLIQHGLYRHIQARTGAGYYTPFFVHSTDSHRSYWLLHLSNHRQARDEMGKLHWRLNNHFQHHGEAGFHALGYDPSKDIRQGLMTFMFDDDAMARSEAAVLEQLPRMIHEANRDGGAGLSMEQLFAGNCNDTPVTSEILERQLILLREEGELTIVNEVGTLKPRARTVAWDDRLILPRQQSMFARLRHR
jgi:three-Cys-motif partner protein